MAHADSITAQQEVRAKSIQKHEDDISLEIKCSCPPCAFFVLFDKRKVGEEYLFTLNSRLSEVKHSCINVAVKEEEDVASEGGPNHSMAFDNDATATDAIYINDTLDDTASDSFIMPWLDPLPPLPMPEASSSLPSLPTHEASSSHQSEHSLSFSDGDSEQTHPASTVVLGKRKAPSRVYATR